MTVRALAGCYTAGTALLLACGPEAMPATAVYAVTAGGALYRSTDGAAMKASFLIITQMTF